MFNVLHLIDTYETGGAETVFAQVATGLDPVSFRSIPVLLGQGWLYHHLRSRGLEPIVLQTRGAFDVTFLRALTALIREQRVDLVHSHLLTSAVYGCIAVRRTGVPLLATFHGEVDIEARLLRTKVAIINGGARRIAFVSDTLRRRILRKARFRPDLTSVVQNGVDLDRFRFGRDLTWRRSLGISDDAFLIGGVGRATAVKDFSLLIRSVARLRTKHPELRLVIVGASDPDGDRTESARLIQLREALNLGDAVHFVDFQEDIPSVMASLDLLAITSRSEGFGLTAVEALATGVPVVSTRSGGPEEILTDGRDGLLIPVGDAEALDAAVLRVLEDTGLRESLRSKGRRTAENRFSLSRTLSRYESTYRALLGERMRTRLGDEARRTTPRTSVMMTVKDTARSILTSPAVVPLWRPFTAGTATIFMMHRFDSPEHGIKGHCPKTLAANLEWLRANRFVISSLRELVSRFAAGEPPLPRTVVFTVDDGYADFAYVGAPVFARYDCPVTTFLVTGFLDGQTWLWYDAVEAAFGDLSRDAFDLVVGDVTTRVSWATDAERQARISHVVEYLKSRPTAEVESAVRSLVAKRGGLLAGAPPSRWMSMTWEDVRRCAAGLVEFGPHSHLHPILSRSEANRAAAEIGTAWRRLQEEIADPLPVFCYPNGRTRDFSRRERDLVRSVGLLAGVAAEGGHCGRSDFIEDRFALPRFAYPDDGTEFRKIVSGLERLNLLLRSRRSA